MDKDFIIKKSNYFIMHSKYNLSLEEQKLILTLASMVKSNDEEFKTYKFKISDFIKLLGIKNKGKYSSVPKITSELMKKVFEIEENDRLIQVAWLSSVVYNKGLGYVELEFSPKLKPYMLNLNKMFTQYKLVNILKMKSKYSPRIYELLKCNEFKQQSYLEISLADLKSLLKIEELYPLYADFKKKVILQSQKEINNNTDINFTYDEIKTGRKVTALKFYIKKNTMNSPEQNKPNNLEQKSNNEFYQPPANVADEDELIDTLRLFIKEPIKTKDLRAILKTANNDVQLIKSKYELAQRQNNIENLTAWLISAIENDFSEPISRRKKNKFINYEQDDWNFEKLAQLEKEYIDKKLSE